jgi:hypothetical protein
MLLEAEEFTSQRRTERHPSCTSKQKPALLSGL